MMKKIGFFAGILFFVVLLLLPPLQTFRDTAAGLVAEGAVTIDAEILAVSMQSVLALMLLMVVWWFTEAVPLSATALLPPIILPLLKVVGVQDIGAYLFTARNVLQHYANPVIYLFFGGFLLAGAMQKWKLDRRFTLWFLTRGNIAGDSRSILLGIMCATAFLSMWISNTAAAALMIPIGIGLLGIFEIDAGKSRYGTALMLGIAWSASIGGVGTIIGSPPNGIALGIINSTFGEDPAFTPISFLDWMKFGVPYIVLMLPVVWFVLIKTHPPEILKLVGQKERLRVEYETLGPLTTGEKMTLSVLLLAVLLWLTNPFWDSVLPASIASQLEWLDAYSIGLSCGVLLFLLPVNFREGKFLMGWEDTKFVEWGTLVLFGGGIALSDAMFKSGLAAWIAVPAVGFFGSPSPIILLLIVVVIVDFLTEVTSNTAVTSMMVPIVISIALQSGDNPVMIAVGAAVAASMAFMLPVATPPNALVYGTGRVPLRTMIRTGFVLDMIGWVMTVVIIYLLASMLLGIF